MRSTKITTPALPRHTKRVTVTRREMCPNVPQIFEHNLIYLAQRITNDTTEVVLYLRFELEITQER